MLNAIHGYIGCCITVSSLSFSAASILSRSFTSFTPQYTTSPLFSWLSSPPSGAASSSSSFSTGTTRPPSPSPAGLCKVLGLPTIRRTQIFVYSFESYYDSGHCGHDPVFLLYVCLIEGRNLLTNGFVG
eukprot:7899874-Alexandrium_andersonii.AAC.1